MHTDNPRTPLRESERAFNEPYDLELELGLEIAVWPDENELLPESLERTQAPRARAVVVTLAILLAVTLLGLALMWAGQKSATAANAEKAQAEDASPVTEPQAETSETQPQTGDAAGETGDETGQRSAEKHDSLASALQADPVWVARVAGESGVPERALKAYATAALVLRDEQPGCGLGWNTLAAIGHVESGHGTIHGASITSDGRVLPRIVGVALDGEIYQAIPDTDGGLLDGDGMWDRAVGPMQFIPQTWSTYGRSAGGSAEPDIDQIDDAALSAATLLCAEGGDLTVAENWIRAVQAYNPSVAYNNDVADIAEYYAAFG
ncbi:MAG: lytic transglycosylase domain-containing protein [Microbacteriaceae bacterium]